MSSNDRALTLIVALGLGLTMACGGEQYASDAEGIGAESPGTEEIEDGVADEAAPNVDELVEKGGGVLSGQPTFFNFGTLGFGETRSVDWVIAATERSELITALDVFPFEVDPIGCAVIEPTDPSLRRCVLTVTFNPPGSAGTFEATLTATDIDGNATSIDVIGVGEKIVL
jgi:hypothetical protein